MIKIMTPINESIEDYISDRLAEVYENKVLVNPEFKAHQERFYDLHDKIREALEEENKSLLEEYYEENNQCEIIQHSTIYKQGLLDGAEIEREKKFALIFPRPEEQEE